MLAPTQLRTDLPTVTKALAVRGIEFDTERFNQLEARRKSVHVETEALQARRNAVSKLIGQLKSRGEDASSEMEESQQIPARLKELEQDLPQVQGELNDWLMTLPNLPHAGVAAGRDSGDDIGQGRWTPPGAQADAPGKPRRCPFEPRGQVALGEPWGLEFDSARKLSGARFMMLRGQIAR